MEEKVRGGGVKPRNNRRSRRGGWDDARVWSKEVSSSSDYSSISNLVEINNKDNYSNKMAKKMARGDK